MRTETIVLNEQRNVTLTAYIQEVGGEFRYVTKRPAILVLPGGGYQYCSAREADPVAMPYLKAGYQVFILRYSVKEDAVWPRPLMDYEEAMELIRSKAEEWNLYEDKIAVIGFSAGGHLAGAAATMSKNRPNAAILGYAVLGNDVKGCNVTAPDTIVAVDDKTCPCFLFSSRTDNVVPVENSVRFMEALIKADIAFESHIYAFGPHGFSTADTSIQPWETKMSARIPNWVQDSIGWLKEVFGEFGTGEMTEPECKPFVNGNHDEYLSIECTLNHLFANPESAEFVNRILEQFSQNPGVPKMDEEMMKFIGKMKFRDVLGYASLSEAQLDEINQKLIGIKNI